MNDTRLVDYDCLKYLIRRLKIYLRATIFGNVSSEYDTFEKIEAKIKKLDNDHKDEYATKKELGIQKTRIDDIMDFDGFEEKVSYDYNNLHKIENIIKNIISTYATNNALNIERKRIDGILNGVTEEYKSMDAIRNTIEKNYATIKSLKETDDKINTVLTVLNEAPEGYETFKQVKDTVEKIYATKEEEKATNDRITTLIGELPLPEKYDTVRKIADAINNYFDNDSLIDRVKDIETAIHDIEKIRKDAALGASMLSNGRRLRMYVLWPQLNIEIRKINDRITKEVQILNDRITDEVSTLNNRITNEVKILNDRITDEVNKLNGAEYGDTADKLNLGYRSLYQIQVTIKKLNDDLRALISSEVKKLKGADEGEADNQLNSNYKSLYNIQLTIKKLNSDLTTLITNNYNKLDARITKEVKDLINDADDGYKNLKDIEDKIKAVDAKADTKADKTWVNDNFATINWCNNTFLTSHQSLASYATTSWVQSQGYITAASLPPNTADPYERIWNDKDRLYARAIEQGGNGWIDARPYGTGFTFLPATYTGNTISNAHVFARKYCNQVTIECTGSNATADAIDYSSADSTHAAIGANGGDLLLFTIRDSAFWPAYPVQTVCSVGAGGNYGYIRITRDGEVRLLHSVSRNQNKVNYIGSHALICFNISYRAQ